MYTFYIMSRSLPAGPCLLHLGLDVEGAAARDALVAALRERIPTLEVAVARVFARDPAWSGTGGGHALVATVEAQAREPLEALLPSLVAELGAEPRVSLYRECDAGPPVGRQRTGRAILHVNVDVAPEHREPFLRWYVGEHVPAVLDAPGMLAARRFENVLASGGASAPAPQHTYFTLYEMDDVEVISRPETLAASQRGACPPELEPLRRASNRVYAEVFAQEGSA